MSIYGATIERRWWVLVGQTRTSLKNLFGFGQGGKCVYRREGSTLEKVLLYFLIQFMEADQL